MHSRGTITNTIFDNNDSCQFAIINLTCDKHKNLIYFITILERKPRKKNFKTKNITTTRCT